MTLVYRPEEGAKGSYMQCLREAEALAAALRDPAMFASVLREFPEQATGWTETHATEIGIVVERLEGDALVISAFERGGVVEA